MEILIDIAQKTPEELLFLLEEKELLLAEKDNQISQKDHKIDDLEWRLNKLLHETYGKRSEKQDLSHQGRLFDEAGKEVEETAPEDEVSEAFITAHKRIFKGRPALSKNLPRLTKTYDLSDEEKICSCGCELVKIGEKTKEQLEFIPAQVRVIKHLRYQYACRECEETMRLADMPKQPIPKSIASPGLLAHVLVSKFQDHLPFYRQEQMLARSGIYLNRRSFCTWAQQCAELLKPLVQSMKLLMNAHDIGYSDETRLQVLKEPERKADSHSYMWLFIGGGESERSFVYQYAPSRSHQIPKDFWSEFSGFLHTDGYSAYQTLFNNDQIPINGLHCWAHTRRKFLEAAKQSKKATLANWMIKEIAKLYHLEKTFKKQGYSPQHIFEQRQKKSKPILEKIKQWLDVNQPKVPPQHPIGKAMSYTLKFWGNLVRYIDDGRFEVDNNRTERGIKPFVIGRKNWLFHDSTSGAEAGAIIYSLIETCKEHKINPYFYLRYVLQVIPNSDKSEKTYRSLLPFNIDRDILT